MSDSSDPVLAPRREASFDRELLERIRVALKPYGPAVERLWFGGVVFSVRGELVVGVRDGALLARVGPLGSPRHAMASASPLMIDGVRILGWFRVDQSALAGGGLSEWVVAALAYVGSAGFRAAMEERRR